MRVILVALLLLLAAALPAQAESAGPPRADVILLLDRSGSMVQNDPGGLSLEGARIFVDMLNPDDRVAVLAFDGETRTVIHLTARGNGAAIQQAINGLGRPTGQWTDIRGALVTALERLGTAEPDRRPAVVLFTDGQPQTQADGVPAGYREELATVVSRMAGRQVPVFTVGLGQADFDLLHQVASGTKAESFAATSADQVVGLFSSVLSRIKERNVVLSFSGKAGESQSFQVPPYTRLLTLSGVGGRLTGTLPDGKPMASAPGLKSSQGANYTVYTIPNPSPGTWTVQLEGQGTVEAHGQTESALRIGLTEPQPYSQVAKGRPVPLQVSVTGDPDPTSPLEVWAQAGTAAPVKLNRTGDSFTATITFEDGALAVWAARGGAEVARREFRLYPVATALPVAGATIGAPAKSTPWAAIAAGFVAAAALLLIAGALNWQRIRRREEVLSGRIGTHSLNGRGREIRIGDLAILEAKLTPQGWAPLAGMGLLRRQLELYIRPTAGIRIQINGRPPADGRLYHADEVTLGGESHIVAIPQLGRRPASKPLRARVSTSRKSTIKG